jgi:alpha-beta hydrolase superfamily lysophospholipase
MDRYVLDARGCGRSVRRCNADSDAYTNPNADSNSDADWRVAE